MVLGVNVKGFNISAIYLTCQFFRFDIPFTLRPWATRGLNHSITKLSLVSQTRELRYLKTSLTSLPSEVYLLMIQQHFYRISGIFRVGLIFVEFASSLKSPKIDTAKYKLYNTSSFRVLEIAKIGLSENLKHLPSVAKISRREKFPIL